MSATFIAIRPLTVEDIMRDLLRWYEAWAARELEKMNRRSMYWPTPDGGKVG